MSDTKNFYNFGGITSFFKRTEEGGGGGKLVIRNPELGSWKIQRGDHSNLLGQCSNAWKTVVASSQNTGLGLQLNMLFNPTYALHTYFVLVFYYIP